MEFLGINLELFRLSPSQYANFNFNSMCEFKGQYLGASENGVFTLFDADDDNGADIDAWIKCMKTDFGMLNQKRVRNLKIGCEASGDLTITVTNDDWNERTYALSLVLKNQLQHARDIPVGRNGKGAYWSFKIANSNGCDFSIDYLLAALVVMAIRSPQWIWWGNMGVGLPMFTISATGTVT